MDKNANDNSPSNLWTRRSNSSKLSLSANKDRSDGHDSPAAKRFTSLSSHGGKGNPFNSLGSISTSGVASPTGTGASASFGLGSGAFANFGGSAKTPKTPGASFDLGKTKESSEESVNKDARRLVPRNSLAQTSKAPTSAAEPSVTAPGSWPLKHTWVIYYRPPTTRNSDYEKSIKPLCRINTAQAFWQVYTHLKRPSDLPTVSDYHVFREGIRPVWEDEENKRGGKWTMRLKKGVADRYWEELLLAIVGDQFVEASDEVCGAVVSVRSGEDVFSIWTKNNGGRNVKIRETVKRVLSLPNDTNLQWISHDERAEQDRIANQTRQEKANQNHRRNTLVEKKESEAG